MDQPLIDDTTAEDFDLDAVLGDLDVCMQSPECTDGGSPNC